jgi:hypothetical protein
MPRTRATPRPQRRALATAVITFPRADGRFDVVCLACKATTTSLTLAAARQLLHVCERGGATHGP